VGWCDEGRGGGKGEKGEVAGLLLNIVYVFVI